MGNLEETAENKQENKASVMLDIPKEVRERFKNETNPAAREYIEASKRLRGEDLWGPWYVWNIGCN